MPADIVDVCQRTGRPFFVIAFEGQAEPDLYTGIPHMVVRLGAAGRTLKALRDNGVEEIIFVGGIKRPNLAQIRPDLWGVKFLAQSGALALGDDGFLTTLVKKLERDEGFRVVGVKDIAKKLLAPKGVIGSKEPTESDLIDIRAAVRAALELGAEDIGQAAVSRDGNIIGLEDAEGTDALLQRISEIHSPVNGQGLHGVLAKVAKPQQERRADLPTIGVMTVRNAAKAGLAGIVVEAQGSIILEKQQLIAKADELGLFVFGVAVKDFTDDV